MDTEGTILRGNVNVRLFTYKLWWGNKKYFGCELWTTFDERHFSP